MSKVAVVNVKNVNDSPLQERDGSLVEGAVAQIVVVVANYNKDEQVPGTHYTPDIVDRFEVSGDIVNDAKHMYREFSNFMLGYQDATLMHWGQFIYNFLSALSDEANGDFQEDFPAESEQVVNMQVTFREHLSMRRFVSFRDAFSKIAGRKIIPSEYEEIYTLAENQVRFLPHALGHRFLKRHDIKKNRETSKR